MNDNIEIIIPIIERKRTTGTLVIFSISITLLVVLIISIFNDSNKNPPHFFTMSIAIILICLVFFDIFRSYKVEDFRRIGNLVISNKGIQIFTNDNEVFYPINKIKKVTFRINETSVDSVISFNLGVFKTKEGIDNEIEIIDTNDLKLKYKVFIKDQLWLRLIDGVLLIWSNVNVVKIKRNKVTTKLSD